MERLLRRRFYAETVLGAITAILFLATLVSRAWIEVLFHIDPDQGQGWVEWMIVAALLAATVACGVLARTEWRRAGAASA